jgi:chromosome partitioning protein
VFRTQIHERDAYKALFSFGGTLESLDPGQVSNLENAIINAREYASEVVAMLKSVAKAAEMGVANG